MNIDWNDEQVCLFAIKQHSGFFVNVSDRLKNDKDFIIRSINLNDNTKLFAYLSDRLKDDKDVIMASIIKNGGMSLSYASDRLKDDYDVVFAAVSNAGRALNYASNRLRKDKRVVLAAVKNYGYILHNRRDESLDDFRNDIDILEAHNNYFTINKYDKNEYRTDSDCFETLFKRYTDLKLVFEYNNFIKNYKPSL